MPKAKSEKTLAAEAEHRQLIEAEIAKYSKPGYFSKYRVLTPTLKSKLKGPEDVLIRKGRLTHIKAAWLLKLKQELDAEGAIDLRLDKSYLFAVTNAPQGSKVPVTVVAPCMWGSDAKKVVAGVQMHFIKAGSDPLLQVLQWPSLDTAAAMTWPDDLGNVKIWSHVSSKLTRAVAYKLWKASEDGINWQALEGKKDWSNLATYISTRKAFGDDIKLKTICSVVKTISRSLAVDEMQQEQNKLKESW